MNTVYLLRGPSFPATSPPTPKTHLIAVPAFPQPLPFSSVAWPSADALQDLMLIPSKPAVPTLYRAAAWALVWSAVMSSSGLPSFRAGLGPRTCRSRRDYKGFCTQIFQVTTCRATCVLHYTGEIDGPSPPTRQPLVPRSYPLSIPKTQRYPIRKSQG